MNEAKKIDNQQGNGVYSVLTAGICKPILFSTPMIQAIMRNDKTQTRRKIKHKNKIEEVRPVMRCFENENDWGKYILTDEFGEDFLIKPKYNIGDFIWVRERSPVSNLLTFDQLIKSSSFIF